MTIPNASPLLFNEDLAPATERKWGAFSIFNVWTSDVHSLWGYYLAASLFLLCGNFLNFILAIGLGSLVIFFLMNLVGYAGVKTGVPYPVLARASFGIWGANVPALVRAIVACFWYGAQVPGLGGAHGRDHDAHSRHLPLREGRRVLLRQRDSARRAARQDQGC